MLLRDCNQNTSAEGVSALGEDFNRKGERRVVPPAARLLSSHVDRTVPQLPCGPERVQMFVIVSPALALIRLTWLKK